MYFVKYGREYLHDPRIDGRMLLDLKLDCEENSCGFCDFTIYPDHPMYDKLKEHDADNPIEVYDDNVMLFAGFIYELGKEFYLDGHVKCKGDLDYLNDSIVRPYSTVEKGYGLHASNTVSSYFEWLIRQHNDQAAPSKEFIVGTNQGNSLNNAALIFEESIEYPTVMEEIKKNLLDVYGGYLSVRNEDGKRYIDYLSERRDANTQILDFGVNLTDYTQTDDSSEVATFVIPLGAKMSETEYEYDDGYFQTTDTSVDIEKEYYTENNDGYSRCEELTDFVAGTTYYESDDNGYFVTADTTCDAEKQYYVRNTEITGYSKCNDLEFFKTNVTYYEYDENEDESELLLTIDTGDNLTSSYAGYIRSGDILYSQDGISKYGWIGMSYKNTELTTREELIDAGAIALKEKVSPKRTIEIKAVDMHLVNPSVKPIRIGEYVRVRSKPHKLDSYFLCASIDLDMNNPENSLYTLGTTFDTLTGQQNKRINELNATIHKQYEKAETVILEQTMSEAGAASRLASGAYAQAVLANTAAIAARLAADDATARVTLVESQVTNVSAATEQAIQSAGDAIESAGQATAIANQIESEISDVKGDAESLRIALEDRIETKVTTMTADYVRTTDLTTTETTLRSEITRSAAALSTEVEQTYAKTTDLTAVETELRSELRQTSSSIESVVSDVTTVQVDVTTAQTAADTAQQLANAAQASANQAGSGATAAQNAANAAQDAADAAQADVDSLRSTTVTRFSEIEQTASGISTTVSEVQSTINNISIGGRNLLLNTDFTKGIAGWIAWQSRATLSVVNGYLKVTPTDVTAGAYYRYYGANIEANQEYTLTFYAYADSNTVLNYCYIMSSNGNQALGKTFNLTTIPTKFKYTFTKTSDINDVSIMLGSQAGTVPFYFKGLKLEKGNQPTDWEIAPEDTETRMSEIEQDVSGLTISLTDTNTNVGNAAKGATDYLSFSSAGLAVGDMTAGTLGKNVLIGTDSINIRNGSTILAAFRTDEVEFDESVVFKADGVLMDNGDAFAYLGRNNILWSTTNGFWMNASQTIPLSANITRQLSGAVFAWALYQNNVSQNDDWFYFFMPKLHVVRHGGTRVRMHDAYLGINKILYVSNGNVTGHDQNMASGTTNGIAWNNTKWTLRYVIGV